jgi:hypothetical protein
MWGFAGIHRRAQRVAVQGQMARIKEKLLLKDARQMVQQGPSS